MSSKLVRFEEEEEEEEDLEVDVEDDSCFWGLKSMLRRREMLTFDCGGCDFTRFGPEADNTDNDANLDVDNDVDDDDDEVFKEEKGRAFDLWFGFLAFGFVFPFAFVDDDAPPLVESCWPSRM